MLPWQLVSSVKGKCTQNGQGGFQAFESRGTIVDLTCPSLAAPSLLRLARAPTPGKLCTDSGPMPNPRTGSQQVLAQSWSCPHQGGWTAEGACIATEAGDLVGGRGCCEWGTQRSRKGPGPCGFQRKSACSRCPLEDWLGTAPTRPSSTSAAQLLQEARPAQALGCPLEQTATFFCMEKFGFKERDFIFIGL